MLHSGYARLSKRLASLGILLLATVPLLRAQSIYEAENQVNIQNCSINRGGSWKGFSGSGFIENMTQRGAYGTQQGASSATFSVSVATSGMYKVSARYAAAREYNSTMSVYVNGIDVTQAQFATTASWDSWDTQAITVALQAGAPNTIKYQYDSDDSGWINLDFITVNPAWSPGYTPGSAAAGALPSEIGVNKFTGTATFDATLYTVAIPGVALPIGLHYSAAGIQAEDTGGEIGINWSLQAGLSIHRQVQDLPDDIKEEDPDSHEWRYGWLRYPAGARIDDVPNVTGFNATACTADEQNALTKILAFGSLAHVTGTLYSMYDTQPDIFTYSVPGYSGKFVFDGTGAIHLMPYAPLQITPFFSPTNGSCTAMPDGELSGFTIKTAEGVLYTLFMPNRIAQQSHSSASYGGNKFLLRNYYVFKTNQYISGPTPLPGPTLLYYTTDWMVTRIANSAINANSSTAVIGANSITFTYDCSTFIPNAESEGNGLLLGNSSNPPAADHSLTTLVIFNPKLTAINSPTATVTLARELDESDNFHVTTLAITSPQEVNALIKSYTFQSTHLGRFLSKVLLNRTGSTLPLYTFSYAPETGGTLPAHSSDKARTNQDYWGFANGNRARTGIPRLYVYPQLLAASSSRPAAPYRLYPAPDYENGGIVLPGADRRPANRLAVSLAGTLTGVTFATGGQVALEYEQNQFYDPVAQQSLPAGGLRIRTIKMKDPVTRVESRRDYNYQQAGANNSGVSSGVLLHLPRFAFVMPLTSSVQWADATVRATDDLAPDPFESRPVGYGQVTEIVPGKGQVTTAFSVPGGADDNSSPADATSNLPAWQRPLFGVARQSLSGGCPSIAPLQALSELYPFAPAPNYEFCRGLPQTVWYRAEPTGGTAPGALVRQEDYTYQYVNARPGAAPVTGLRYEQLGNTTQSVFAYAKYTLLTDYFYLPRQQVTSQLVAGGTTSQSSVRYSYNNQGWLASKTMQGTDNTVTRTRYKYLSDYALPASGATGELLAMTTRVGEGVTSDLVESISEIRPAGSSGSVAYAGATLQTFITGSALDATNNPVATPTYPYQLRSWQPAQAVATYDSVRVDNTSLHIPTALRVASTVLAVDPGLTPISVRTTAGRQVAGKHLGYAGTVPLLQINNATAAEVVFSDFETEDKPYSFRSSGAQFATAARTGNYGYELPAGTSLTTMLPASAAPQYRLVFWARATGTAGGAITISAGSSVPFTSSFSTTSQWQRYDVLLPVGTLANRTSYQLALTSNSNNGNVNLQVDDVVLLPADATTVSATYTLTLGKTSETDARGRTTYYEYAPTGDLALVRDHNRSIQHQYLKGLPGQTMLAGISFTASGTMIEGDPISFTAMTGLKGPLEYKWDWGDNTAVTVYSSSAQQTHAYLNTGQGQLPNVRLYVRSQGTEYVIAQSVTINPIPLTLTNCTAGIVSFDDCSHCCGASVDTNCNPNAPDPNNSTTFQVTPNLSGNLTYQWEWYDTSATASGPYWANMPSSSTTAGSPTSATVTVGRASNIRCRCRVSNGIQEVTSEEFVVQHYKSDLNCP